MASSISLDQGKRSQITKHENEQSITESLRYHHNHRRAMKQALRIAEDLTLPKVQVIVMTANMSCKHCRRRVSTIISKTNGLLDYMVDLKKKEVMLTAIVDTEKRKLIQDPPMNKKKRRCTLALSRFLCLGAL